MRTAKNLKFLLVFLLNCKPLLVSFVLREVKLPWNVFSEMFTHFLTVGGLHFTFLLSLLAWRSLLMWVDHRNTFVPVLFLKKQSVNVCRLFQSGLEGANTHKHECYGNIIFYSPRPLNFLLVIMMDCSWQRLCETALDFSPIWKVLREDCVITQVRKSTARSCFLCCSPNPN